MSARPDNDDELNELIAALSIWGDDKVQVLKQASEKIHQRSRTQNTTPLGEQVTQKASALLDSAKKCGQSAEQHAASSSRSFLHGPDSAKGEYLDIVDQLSNFLGNCRLEETPAPQVPMGNTMQYAGPDFLAINALRYRQEQQHLAEHPEAYFKSSGMVCGVVDYTMSTSIPDEIGTLVDMALQSGRSSEKVQILLQDRGLGVPIEYIHCRKTNTEYDPANYDQSSVTQRVDEKDESESEEEYDTEDDLMDGIF